MKAKKSQPYSSTHIWNILDNLSLRFVPSREYFTFAGAQGGAVAIRGERGIILDSSEGLVLTTAIDAAKYMAGDISFNQVMPLKAFVINLKDEKTMTVWVESDRFVDPCSCTPIPIPEMETCRVSGEDDCPIHGFTEDESL